MTPRNKAEELFNKFMDAIPANSSSDINEFMAMDIKATKECAKIACDEIINAGKDVDQFCDSYWQEVKREIEKL